jgi:hypothetical protein
MWPGFPAESGLFCRLQFAVTCGSGAPRFARLHSISTIPAVTRIASGGISHAVATTAVAVLGVS